MTNRLERIAALALVGVMVLSVTATGAVAGQSATDPLTRDEIAEERFGLEAFETLDNESQREVEEIYDRQPLAENVTIDSVQTRDGFAQSQFGVEFEELDAERRATVEAEYDAQFADARRSTEFSRDAIANAKFGADFANLSGESVAEVEEIWDRQPFVSFGGSQDPADILTRDEIAQAKFGSNFERVDAARQRAIEDLYDRQFPAVAAGTDMQPEQPANFQLTALDADSPVQQGNSSTVTATIENQGNGSGTQNVSLSAVGENITTGTDAVDVVFVIDGSGSMSEEIATVRDQTEAFATRLENESVDAQFAVVQSSGTVTELTPGFTSSSADVEAALANVTGGEEFNYDAVQLANELDGRESARRVIIDFTDEGSSVQSTTPSQGALADQLSQNETKFIAVTPPQSELEDKGTDARDKRVLANLTDDGVWFNLDGPNLSERFREEIATEVINASRAQGQELSLEAGESRTITFDLETDQLPPAEYDVTISTANDTAATTITVES